MKKTMNKIMMIVMIAIAATSVTFGQTKMAKDSKVEAQLIANERAVWKSLTDGKFDAFAGWLTEDYQGFYPDQMTVKASEVAGASQTKFKRVDLSNFKVQMLDKNNAIVMYEVSSDVTTPDGKDVSTRSRQSSVHTKRGGKWRVAYHTDFKIEK